MSIGTLQTIKKNCREQQDAFVNEAKNSINEELKSLLSQPDIHSIGWAAKSGEYNDEGMYPGVVGPFINMDDNQNTLSDLVYEELTSDDARTDKIKQILDVVGQDVLCEIFGEEAFVTASLNKNNKVQYQTESMQI